jgi:hypothetical protein
MKAYRWLFISRASEEIEMKEPEKMETKNAISGKRGNR